MKKVVSCLLIAVLVSFIFFDAAKASAKPSFAYDTYVTRVGQAVKVKMKGAVQKQIKWTSRDPKIAKITKTGKIKGIKVGETTIAAEYKGTRLTFKMVVVPKKVPKIKDIYSNLEKCIEDNRTNKADGNILDYYPEYKYSSNLTITDILFICFENGDLKIYYSYSSFQTPTIHVYYGKEVADTTYDLSQITKSTILDISTDEDVNKKASKLFHETLAALDDFLFEKMPEYTLADLGFINY